MKSLFLIPLLLCSLAAGAVRTVRVGSGKVTTAPGIGGYAQIGYAFAKGDVVTINAQAEKKLQRMMVLLFPDVELGKDMATKNSSYTFTMPKDGIIVFRFISDRGGTNDINYSVTRTPGSNATQNYDTRVVWHKPAAGSHGDLIPMRTGETGTVMTSPVKPIE